MMSMFTKYSSVPKQSVEPTKLMPRTTFCGKISAMRPEMKVPIAYANMKAVSICESTTLSTPARTSSVLTLV